MKYILLCTAALVICIVCGLLITLLIRRAKKFGRGATVGFTCLFSVVLMCAVAFGYLSVYYPADASADTESPIVQKKQIDGGYFFDGPGRKTALIFYPGAKVDTVAYAPLLTSLAERGVDCFLADMPFRMAIFGGDTGDKFLSAYSYDNWIAAGHSMGGLSVSGYASSHADKISTLVLLASYPSSTVPAGMRFCSIYGTEDGCLDKDVYEQSREYWPQDASEHIIEGGNHAQYANYGPQDKDGEAGISREEQQDRTVEIILQAIAE